MYEVDRIFWRNLTGGDYFNIEKVLPSGARGQLHIDLSPAEPVEDFLGIEPIDEQAQTQVLAQVGVMGSPAETADLQFNKRPNGRWGFPQQNWRDEDSKRHPAWTPTYGWPRLDAAPASTQDGERTLASVGGVHVYVVRTVDGKHFAGMTTGNTLPEGWPAILEPLFTRQTKNAGLIRPRNTSGSMSALAKDILDAFTRRKNVLVYGPPGTGKTHAVSQVFRFLNGDVSVAPSRLMVDPQDPRRPFRLDRVINPMPAPTRADWITFHQDYGYEDFMIGLRPTGSGFALEPVAGRLVDLAMDVASGSSSSGVIVVDEINRGNVPKILGDFLTYMDEDYRDGRPSAIEVRLPKVNGDPADPTRTELVRRLDGTRTALPVPWYFPTEVYLLATMNSVDRAVAPLDTALGRRFERIDAMPDLDLLAAELGVEMADVDVAVRPRDAGHDVVDNDEGDTAVGAPTDEETEGQLEVEEVRWTAQLAAVALLRYLNDEVAERLGTDFELGHVYFLRVTDWSDLARTWDLSIWPQLRDRFGARPEQLSEILRADGVDGPAGYPFRRRRPGGRALAISAMSDLTDELCAKSFWFMITGNR